MVTKCKDYNLLREVKNKKEKSPLFHTLKFLVLYIIREQSKNGPPPPALNSWRATLKEKKGIRARWLFDNETASALPKSSLEEDQEARFFFLEETQVEHSFGSNAFSTTRRRLLPHCGCFRIFLLHIYVFSVKLIFVN